VSAVHGVSGLESDDLLPAELVEVGTQLRRGDYEVQVSLRLGSEAKERIGLQRRSRKS
jgi:hypothetical protein